MLESVLPARSAGDVLAGRTWLALGTQVYEVPALTIDASERWLASVDIELASILGGLEDSGDDLPAILAILTGRHVRLLDLLISYDVTHVLPPRDELTAVVTKPQLLTAILGVWQTENPLVGLAVAGLNPATLGTVPSAPSEPTSTSRPPTAGRRKRSAGH